MHGDVVSLHDGGVEVLAKGDTEAFRTVFGQIRIVGHDAHAEGLRPLSEFRTDAAHAQDDEGFAIDFGALEALAVPFTADDGGVRLGSLAGEGHHEGEGLLCGGNGVTAGGVHHHDAALGGDGDVDVVHADAGTAHDFEVGGGFEHLGGHLGTTADDDGVSCAGCLDHGVLGLEIHVHLDRERRLRFEQVDAFARNGVVVAGDEDIELGHGLFLGERGRKLATCIVRSRSNACWTEYTGSVHIVLCLQELRQQQQCSP